MLMQTQTSSKGRTATFPVITNWDVRNERPINELLAELAVATEWSLSKCLDKLNFGVKNTCQGQCHRESESSPKKMAGRLGKKVSELLTDDVDAAVELNQAIIDQGDDLTSLYEERFPNGSTEMDRTWPIGAEKAAGEG